MVSWFVMIPASPTDGKIKDASKLFAEMHERNIVSWDTMGEDMPNDVE